MQHSSRAYALLPQVITAPWLRTQFPNLQALLGPGGLEEAVRTLHRCEVVSCGDLSQVTRAYLLQNEVPEEVVKRLKPPASSWRHEVYRLEAVLEDVLIRVQALEAALTVVP
jgi:hypothetical protein